MVWSSLIHPAASRTSEVWRNFLSNMHIWLRPLAHLATSIDARVKLWNHRSPGPDDSGVQQATGQNPTPVVQAPSNSNSSIRRSHPRWSNDAEDGDPSIGASSHAIVRCFPSGAMRAIEIVSHRWERLSIGGFMSYLHRGTAAAPTKASRYHILTVQATRWLLETTSNSGEQISTIQFICSMDRATCTHVFEDHDSWKRLLSLTIGVFEAWYSQPSKENQEIAELFGLVLSRVIFQCPKEDGKWRDITEGPLQAWCRFAVFFRAIKLVSGKCIPRDSGDHQRFLHLAVIYAVLEERIDFKQYQWLKSSCLLESKSPVAATLLLVWSQLAFQVGNMYSFPLHGLRPSLMIAPDQWDSK